MAEERMPSNSHKSKENEPRIEKVVSGEVIRKERSTGKKLLDRFVENDAETIGSYIVDDIVIPTIKDLLRDVLNNTVDMFLYGESSNRGRQGSRRGSNTRVSYSDYYRSNGSRDRQNERRAEVRRTSVDDVTFPSRVDAEEVMDSLLEAIEDYGCVSVADFYSASGISSKWTDNNYGWYSLNTARIEPARGGRYYIRLPKPQPLD